MLQARRLCEAGVGFVTIDFGGWDMHGQIAQGMRNLGPQVDHAVSAFVQDLHQRGLEDDILLVISGEFGRTPRVNGGAGRDHWAPLSTLALAGGGLRMGQVVGESNAQRRGAAHDADHAAAPDGHGVPRARHAAGPALQRPDRPAHADDYGRPSDSGTSIIG